MKYKPGDKVKLKSWRQIQKEWPDIVEDDGVYDHRDWPGFIYEETIPLLGTIVEIEEIIMPPQSREEYYSDLPFHFFIVTDLTPDRMHPSFIQEQTIEEQLDDLIIGDII